MVPDIELTDEFEDGRIYTFLGSVVYVPTGTPDRVGSDVDSDQEAVRAAEGLNRKTPFGVAVFEDGVWDADTRARLWAKISDAVALDEPLEWTQPTVDDVRRACVPAVVVAEGRATVAAYLATLNFSVSEIASALDVGNRTVSQYITDFRKGER